jgi:hypothetical protein
MNGRNPSLSCDSFYLRVKKFADQNRNAPLTNDTPRPGFPVNSGYDSFPALAADPRVDLLNQLKNDGPRVWEEEPFDAIPFYTAMEYLKTHKPRVLFVSFGETDDWAHEGDYAQYLNAAHRVDDYLRRLWATVQSMPEYSGKTALIFSPDHGRGSGHHDWRDHGEKITDSKYIWMAFLGPDTPPLGERANVGPVSKNQIAATLAALLGEDYSGRRPKLDNPLRMCCHTEEDWPVALEISECSRLVAARSQLLFDD